jgi:hypothetical protein
LSVRVCVSTGDFFIGALVQVVPIGQQSCTWFDDAWYKDNEGAPSWSWEMIADMNGRVSPLTLQARFEQMKLKVVGQMVQRFGHGRFRLSFFSHGIKHVRLCLNSLALRSN